MLHAEHFGQGCVAVAGDVFAAGFAVWKRRAYEILPMMLLLGCWGTLLLGPVVSLRYALPLIYCVPRLLEMIVGLTGKR